jgi:hypothetical protein
MFVSLYYAAFCLRAIHQVSTPGQNAPLSFCLEIGWRLASMSQPEITPTFHSLWIEIHNQMKVIAHDGKGINGHCKVLSQMQQALLEPIFTMFIVFAGESINTTQPAPAHTPRDDVIVHGIVGINQLVSGCRHVLILVHSTFRLWRMSA